MINVSDLQLAYVDMYKALREYIWSYPTVEAIAELEISVYQACPDVEVIRRNFYRLDQLVREVKFDDEDMKKAFDSFSDIMNSDESIYCKLYMVNEVKDNENI